MRYLPISLILLGLSACSPPPPTLAPPTAESSAAPNRADPRDPLERANAVEGKVLEQKEQQDRAMQEQGG